MKGEDQQVTASGQNIKQLRPAKESPEVYGSDYEITKRAVIFGAKGGKQRGHTSL